jgi:membrane-associated phospholipid phosphatase
MSGARGSQALAALAMWAVLSVVVGASAQAPGSAPAPAEKSVPASAPLQWDPAWPTFRPFGYGLMAGSASAAIAVTLLVTYPEDPRWKGPILFDAAIRDGLRARSPGLRDAIRVASDITLFTGIINTVVLESLIVPLAAGSPAVAFQLQLMDAQAFSLNVLIATLLFKAVARARPPQADCSLDPDFDPLCGTGSYASFPSSHTSTAFTAAGLSCVHHAYLPLYGGPWDASACAGALALATATGLFRIAGDRHYMTDVLMGAAIGLSLGYVYPWLFHYGEHLAPAPNDADAAQLRWGFVPGAAETPYGLSLLGQF